MINWAGRVQELIDEGVNCVLVTIANSDGPTPREVGAKMVVFEDGHIEGSIGGGNLEYLATHHAQKVFDTGESHTKKFHLKALAGQCCGGEVELLFEWMRPHPLAYIFGAGHVGQRLCALFEHTPFQVHMIDERREWIEKIDPKKNVVIHNRPWEDVIDDLCWDEKRSFVYVMTHSHQQDRLILENILGRETRFVGLIGSKQKKARFWQALKAKGHSPQALDKIVCPIGLDLGCKTPQAVAIGIAAQSLSLYHNRETYLKNNVELAPFSTPTHQFV